MLVLYNGIFNSCEHLVARPFTLPLKITLLPKYTPYSKMAAILVFFCLFSNWPFWPRFQTQNSKEYITLNEAKRANLQSHKRILKWRPFWNKVYSGAIPVIHLKAITASLKYKLVLTGSHLRLFNTGAT